MAVTREIILGLSEDDFGGPLPSNGRFVATASKARVAGSAVTVPQTLSRDIVAGAFVSPVFLEVNSPEWLWQIQVRDEEDTVMVRRSVMVPAGVGPIAVGDLPIVEGSTLDSTEEPEPLWWAALEQRPVIVRLTQEEYDALSTEQKNDPGIFYVIPALTP